MNKSYIWLIVIVVVIVVGAIFLSQGYKGGQTPNTENPANSGNPSALNLPPATGNIDEAANAALSAVAGEEVTPDQADPTLLNTNADVLNAFDQSFNTTGL